MGQQRYFLMAKFPFHSRPYGRKTAKNKKNYFLFGFPPPPIYLYCRGALNNLDFLMLSNKVCKKD